MANNLKNKEVLSDEILNAIDLIIKHTPNAVFGGSIALNAVGLINRKVSDCLLPAVLLFVFGFVKIL